MRTIKTYSKRAPFYNAFTDDVQTLLEACSGVIRPYGAADFRV